LASRSASVTRRAGFFDACPPSVGDVTCLPTGQPVKQKCAVAHLQACCSTARYSRRSAGRRGGRSFFGVLIVRRRSVLMLRMRARERFLPQRGSVSQAAQRQVVVVSPPWPSSSCGVP
jgi:hypothetical protein